MKSIVEDYLRRSIAVKQAFLEQQSEALVAAAERLGVCLAKGGKVLIFGNGGSAADAQHMATELVVRLSSNFEREAIPALALTTDSSLLTACANDYGFERVFARQVEAFGQAGDVALGISTSGNSGNVIEAFRLARERGMVTVLMSGKTGGMLAELSDAAILVPSTVTSHIQECHIATVHILCELIERRNFGRDA